MSASVGEAGAKPVDSASTTAAKPLGMRKNGKQWHAPKKAFRPGSGLTSYEKRAKDRVALAAVKAKEKEMKEEKEDERKRRITMIKEKRAAKEEKERYAKLAEKMHKKRVERLKRKEKRNKLLNS
ncbi:rRNA-processing protein cgr1 [Gnomoniopsis smithogilvyi]|uniref:rRNA-processing protein n=1 Tax=Gnomoniopsis smithogilvyi TaxID=1191159 RepID=A0A9W8Z1X6_9PEZI|nr:rRNA-processing protein cgr1 [Gnomoniopsis smithogilvyi]